VINIGIFNKLEFWKKYSGEQDSTGIDNEIGLNNNDTKFDKTGIPKQDFSQQGNVPEMERRQPSEFGELSGFEGSSLNPESLRGSDPFSGTIDSNQRNYSNNQPIQRTQQSSEQKDIEVISAKIDAIKLILEDMDRRIGEIEKIAKEE
jgi:hypothetical protein